MFRQAGISAAAALACVALWAPPVSAHHVPLVARMSAERVRPAPGPAGAAGTANVNIDEHVARICYQLFHTPIGPVTRAAVHPGRPGEVGPPVDADAAAVRAIHDAPEAFYVSLTTADFPHGALRGQLQFAG